MPDKDIDKIPITVEVPSADVWLRNDYRDIVHRLGEVHMVRACRHQHDDDFVPMYDYQTVEEYQKKAESLRLECERAWSEVDRIAKQIGEMTTERLQDQLTHGNIMGRIAVALFGNQNNVTDEECVAETAAIGYRITGLYQRLAQVQEERNAANVELKVWQDRYQKLLECVAQAKSFEPPQPIVVEAGSQMVGALNMCSEERDAAIRERDSAKADFEDVCDARDRLVDIVERRRKLLERVLQCGLCEEPHGVGFTPSRQERIASDLARDIGNELRGTKDASD